MTPTPTDPRGGKAERRWPITPLPWKLDGGMIYTAEAPEDHPLGIPIARMDREPGNGTYGAERDSNAAFIVQAVNAHDALVAALTRSIPYLAARATDAEGYRLVRAARAALKLAKGGVS